MKVELHYVGAPVKTSAVGLHEGRAQQKGGRAGDDHEVDQDVTRIRGQGDMDVQDHAKVLNGCDLNGWKLRN